MGMFPIWKGQDMYVLRSNVNANKLSQYAKNFFRNLTRKQKIVFLQKYIIYSLDVRDYAAVEEGLSILFSMNYELRECWRITNNTYTDPEGERVNMYFKHAFSNIKTKRKGRR